MLLKLAVFFFFFVKFHFNIRIQTSFSVLSRFKRQYPVNCPAGCFPSCYSSSQCQQIAPRMLCIQSCCCPAAISPNVHPIFNPGTVCDGGPAVAACINGLCGQGFFCNSRGFCCRCASGNSTGLCINNVCPAGYSCNTNNYCCPLGSGSVLGPCINNQCPIGFACGAGNLCYAVAASGLEKRK
uniref:CC domain-containing protein n=1 Tax=Onchocerca volvulus TaxID=6282 RepID=A0A8R1TWS0_ONCVO